MIRVQRIAAGLILPGLLAGLALSTAHGQTMEGTAYRLNYSPYFWGDLAKSPADPKGRQEDERLDFADKLEAEVIFVGHLGLSASRIRFAREFEDSNGSRINESGRATTVNLTLYGSAISHNAWNLFIGAGYGAIQEYRIKQDTVRVDQSPLHRNIPLWRGFAGIEYSFDRLGIRYEINQFRAKRTSSSGKAELEAMVQFVTFFIPFN